MLKIKTDKGYFEHGNDFSIQIEETSPVMNDVGSQTVPATIPCTPTNARLSGFPYRLDAASVPLQENKSCVVSDGVYHRRGQLNVTSASLSEGITFNIGFDNSEAYSTWKQKKLNEMGNLPVIGSGVVFDLMTTMQNIYWGKENADFAVFPMVIDNPAVDTDDTEKYYPEYLNGTNPLLPDYLYWNALKITRVIDNAVTDVNVPAGYGITGFLYVSKVLDLIFADLGLTVTNNPFVTDKELARLVVLNNVADACVTGFLDYADMLPSVDVETFLNSLYVRFGLVYQINYNTKSVDLRLIRDIIEESSQCDISQALSDRFIVNFETKKFIALSAQTSLEGAEPSYERFEDFIKGCDITQVARTPQFEESMVNALIYETTTGIWYKWDSTNKVHISSGSSFFVWNPETSGCDAEELQSDDEFVPMGRTDNGLYPFYLTGAVHRHTYIRGREGETDDNDTPLAFLWAFVAPWGEQRTCGSFTATTENGNVAFSDGSEHTLSLLFQFSDGLFARFWQKYDEILRHGYLKVDADVRMTLGDIASLDVLKPITLQGQRLLIDTFSYSLPAPRLLPVEFTLRTLRPLGDYDIDEEQNVPDFDAVALQLCWAYYSDNMKNVAQANVQSVAEEWKEDNSFDGVVTATVASISTSGYKTWSELDDVKNNNPESEYEKLRVTCQCKVAYSITAKADDQYPLTDLVQKELEYSVILIAKYE